MPFDFTQDKQDAGYPSTLLRTGTIQDKKQKKDLAAKSDKNAKEKKKKK